MPSTGFPRKFFPASGSPVKDGAVTRAPFALLVFVVASAFAKSTAPEVIFISPCECQGFHGKNRWIVKTDFTPVPLDESAIQSVTPRKVFQPLTRCSGPRLRWSGQ